MVRSRWARSAAPLALLVAIAVPARADRDLVGVTQARFAWTAASGPVVGYRIYLERNYGRFVPHPTTPTLRADETDVVVTGNYGDVIRLQVAAVSSFDQPEGPRSNPSERIKFVAPPSTPGSWTPTPAPAPRTTTPAPARKTPTPQPPADSSPDFDGDGRADLMLREGSSGSTMVWFMDGDGPIDSARVGSVSPSSAILGNGDYNGDGHADLLTRDDTTTALSMQLLVDGAVVGGDPVVSSLSPDWELAGSGDFDKDGRDDILVRSASARRLEVWFMNGARIVSRASLSDPFSSAWQVVGVADFSSDKIADILWYNPSTNTAQVTTFGSWRKIDKNVELFKGTSAGDVVAIGDSDGNGIPDVVVRARDTGQMRIWLTTLDWSGPRARTSLGLDAEEFLPGSSQGASLAGFEVQAGGDFDGDDRIDLVVRDSESGDLRLWLLDMATVESEVPLANPGTTWIFEGVGAESPSTHR